MFPSIITFINEMFVIFSSVFIIFFILDKRIEEHKVTFLKSFIISIFFVVFQPIMASYLFELETHKIQNIESVIKEKLQESTNWIDNIEWTTNQEILHYEDTFLYREYSNE